MAYHHGLYRHARLFDFVYPFGAGSARSDLCNGRRHRYGVRLFRLVRHHCRRKSSDAADTARHGAFRRLCDSLYQRIQLRIPQMRQPQSRCRRCGENDRLADFIYRHHDDGILYFVFYRRHRCAALARRYLFRTRLYHLSVRHRAASGFVQLRKGFPRGDEIRFTKSAPAGSAHKSVSRKSRRRIRTLRQTSAPTPPADPHRRRDDRCGIRLLYVPY